MTEEKNKAILFYHKNCPDGFGSAFAFWKKFGESIEYTAIDHYDEIPDVTGCEVYFADIAPPREVAERVHKQADKVVILDHHISKYEDLKDLPYYKYSDSNSGAVMSWKYLFPDVEPPLVLRCVQARDIWSWDVENAEEFLAVLDSLPFEFREWEVFNSMLKHEKDFALMKGKAILKHSERIIERIMRDVHYITIRGIKVPAINTPFFRSEILERLSQDQPFAAGYHYNGEKFVFSLRSREIGMDVAEIAASFPNGGGHKHASGFSVKDFKELNYNHNSKSGIVRCLQKLKSFFL